MPTTRSSSNSAAISLAIACTAASNWAQLISRTRVRAPLRSWPRRPRGSSLWGERWRSEGSCRRLVERGGMNATSLARRRAADQRLKLVPGHDGAGASEQLDLPVAGNPQSLGEARRELRGPAPSATRAPHQALLDDARHEATGAVEQQTAGEAPPALRGGAVHRVEQPVVQPKWAMEPEPVVDAGDRESGSEPGQPVGPERGGEQAEVGGIGEDAGVEQRGVGQGPIRPDPERLPRWINGRKERVARFDRPELDRGPALERLADPGRNLWHRSEPLPHQLALGPERLGRGHLRHRCLVLEPRLGHLKRADHAQEHLAALDGLHPARGEALAVADPVDLVDDGAAHVARPQEVSVQRVRPAALDRPARGDQRLPDDLSSE